MSTFSAVVWFVLYHRSFCGHKQYVKMRDSWICRTGKWRTRRK